MDEEYQDPSEYISREELKELQDQQEKRGQIKSDHLDGFRDRRGL